jgi:hypothetical protein
MRSLAGQPFFYMIDIWLPKIFLFSPREAKSFRRSDWIDFAIVCAWLVVFMAALPWTALGLSGRTIGAAIRNAMFFGFLIPFLVWSLFISFVTIVQHTGLRARWILPTGRPSRHEQELRGTVHIGFPEPVDGFLHRVMQHIVHHVNRWSRYTGSKRQKRWSRQRTPNSTFSKPGRPPITGAWRARCEPYDRIRDAWCSSDAARSGEAGPLP